MQYIDLKFLMILLGLVFDLFLVSTSEIERMVFTFFLG
jgi:hypothetical protein